MKKFMTNIKTLAILLITGAAFTACSSSDDDIINQPQNPTEPKVYTLVVNASKGDAANSRTTRALSLDGSSLNASWAEGEKVIVYKTEESMFPGTPGMPVKIGTLEATDINGASCTLTGDLDQAPEVNETLQLVFQGSRGTEDGAASVAQDGTLATIQNYFDRAHAEVTVTGVNGTKVSASNAEFVNEKAIVKFVLKNGDDVITPTSVSVTVTHSGYTPDEPVAFSDFASTYTANGSCFFYAISGLSGGDFSGDIALTATDGTDYYTYSKSEASFTAGQYYEIAVKMKKTGALAGQFSVSSSQKVNFSMGNLKASTTDGWSTWTFSFMYPQWQTIETNGEPYCEADYANKTEIGLFCYGTSGYDNGQACYKPNSTITDKSYYNDNLSGNADWGYNAISNGGNKENSGWYTLSNSQLNYLMETRSVTNTLSDGARFTMASVGGHNGMILFPDTYTHPEGIIISGTPVYNRYSQYTFKVSLADWNKMETAGCVFLPSAGDRSGSTPNVRSVNSTGSYWCSSFTYGKAQEMKFFPTNILFQSNFVTYGKSVRLVKNVE